MARKTWLALILIVLLTAQLACTVSAATVPSQTPSSACPTETQDKKLLKNDADGYCLLHPADDVMVPHRFIVINPISAPGDQPGEAWVDINTEAANGRTAAQAADVEITAAGQGFNITRNEITVDGSQAIVVDGLPGPDPLRRLFIVSNDRLYTFSFMPWGQNARLEDLYTTIVNTLHFMPPSQVP